jgi:hypothetical protein
MTGISSCIICGEATSGYASPFDGEPRCHKCAASEISGLLVDCDQEELKTLRRRVEDCLRKNPAVFRRAAIDLMVRGEVKWLDLV